MLLYIGYSTKQSIAYCKRVPSITGYWLFIDFQRCYQAYHCLHGVVPLLSPMAGNLMLKMSFSIVISRKPFTCMTHCPNPSGFLIPLNQLMSTNFNGLSMDLNKPQEPGWTISQIFSFAMLFVHPDMMHDHCSCITSMDLAKKKIRMVFRSLA